MSPTKFYHVIQIILQMCSCDQSLVTVAFLWEKLSQPQFYKDLTRKTAFFEGWSWFRFNNLGLALGTNLEFYTSVAKGLKLKVRKFFRANSYVCRSYRGKLVVRGGGFLPPILNRVKTGRLIFKKQDIGIMSGKKIELCPTKAASQRTQMSNVKLKESF